MVQVSLLYLIGLFYVYIHVHWDGGWGGVGWEGAVEEVNFSHFCSVFCLNHFRVKSKEGSVWSSDCGLTCTGTCIKYDVIK